MDTQQNISPFTGQPPFGSQPPPTIDISTTQVVLAPPQFTPVQTASEPPFSFGSQPTSASTSQATPQSVQSQPESTQQTASVLPPSNSQQPTSLDIDRSFPPLPFFGSQPPPVQPPPLKTQPLPAPGEINADVNDTKPEWIKHSTFDLDSRAVIIQVENTLYKQLTGILRQHSQVLNDIFALPQSFANEGTESNPIFLPGLTSAEFEDYIGWQQNLKRPSPIGTERELYLCNVLKVCHLWNVEHGQEYAISELNMMRLPAPRMLQLGGRFSVRQWIVGAMETLLTTPFLILTDVNFEEIGLKVLSILAKSREAMEKERRIIALTPPHSSDMPAGYGCYNHSSCKKIWVDIWFKRISMDILHPHTPLPFAQVLQRATTLVGDSHIHQCCQDQLLTQLATGYTADQLRIEESVKASAIGAVCEFYGLGRD
ncbi:hypothetical protein DXG01_007016 [Tephrocybe rancida]|nr:hypothetical protein DXG01_007016 [Tephrocybe rancida]